MMSLKTMLVDISKTDLFVYLSKHRERTKAIVQNQKPITYRDALIQCQKQKKRGR